MARPAAGRSTLHLACRDGWRQSRGHQSAPSEADCECHDPTTLILTTLFLAASIPVFGKLRVTMA